MVTFVESPLFSKNVLDYLTDDEYWVFQKFLATSPGTGAVVRGSGGLERCAGAALELERAAVSGFFILLVQKQE